MAHGKPLFCYSHREVQTTLRCEACGRGVCRVCAFETVSGSFCPDCMSSGPRGRNPGASAKYAGGSVALAALGCLLLIAMLAGATALSGTQGEGLAMVLSLPTIGCMVGGLALGLIGRDHARRTGSPLALIGAIANGVLLAAYLLLVLIGTARQ
jgi:hypothetical protein